MEINDVVLNEAAGRFGLDAGALTLLGGMDGRVYNVNRLVDGREVLLKLCMVPDSKLGAVVGQYEFMSYLKRGGMNLSSPIPSQNGVLVETMTSGKEGYSHAVILMEKAPGRHVDVRSDGEFAPPLFREWGRTMGRLHRLAKAYGDGSRLQVWRDEVGAMKSMAGEGAIRDKWAGIEARLESLPSGKDDVGPIHNDMHPWNFFVDEGRITLFDFDVMCRHWFALDIAIALHSGLWSRRPGTHAAFAPHFLEHFMGGYEMENTLDSGWQKEIHFFLCYRHTLLYTVGCVEAEHKDAWLGQVLDGAPFGLDTLA